MISKAPAYHNLQFLIVLCTIITCCKQEYDPHISSPVTGYLVVEGFINTNGITSIQLTRTNKLIDTSKIVYARAAEVEIQSENNQHFPLYESDSGWYRSQHLLLNHDDNYRLYIKTNDGNEYVSDFLKPVTTPEVDSISWIRDADGIHVYVNTHDPSNRTVYYKWNYIETWEFHSSFVSSLYYVYDSLINLPVSVDYKNGGAIDTSIIKCWHTQVIPSVLIGSTEKLSSDRIYLPLSFIEQASVKMSVLYSTLVTQRALTKEAYLFYSKLKKNTEQVGSIFDAQPSELQGNIHNINNKTEPVIGFLTVSDQQQKRIFIKTSELPNWNYHSFCEEIYIMNNADSIQMYGLAMLPTVPKKTRGEFIDIFGAANATCVDCTLRGTNVKPDFWP